MAKRAATSKPKQKPTTKKPAAKKRSGTSAAVPVKPRAYYGGLDVAETIFQLWIQTGTIRGTLRQLRTMRGFETMQENTLRSIFKEHQDDWPARKAELTKQIEGQTNEAIAKEFAALEVEAQRAFLGGLVALAKESARTLPKALRKLADSIDDGSLKAPDLAYSLPRLAKELTNVVRPRITQAGVVVNRNDNRRVTIQMPERGSPRSAAESRTSTQILDDLKRKASAIEQSSV